MVGLVKYSAAHEVLSGIPARSNFDGQIYVRVYYLMREGHGYYDSLLRSFQLDERYPVPPTSVLAWRQPALSYLFSLLPSVDDIYWLYIVLAVFTILSSFLVAYRSTGRALLSTVASMLIANYLASPVLAPRWVVFHEWWGACFLIFGLAMISLKKDAFGAVFLLAAACIREQYALALMGALLASLIYRRSRPSWTIAFIIYAFQYYVHYVNLSALTPGPHFNVGFLLSRPTPLLLPASALFAYLLLQHLPLVVAPLIGLILIIGVLGILGFEDRMLRITCLALVLTVPILSLFIGNIYDYYWGTTYVPVLLLGVPLGLSRTSKLVRRFLGSLRSHNSITTSCI